MDFIAHGREILIVWECFLKSKMPVVRRRIKVCVGILNSSKLGDGGILNSSKLLFCMQIG